MNVTLEDIKELLACVSDSQSEGMGGISWELADRIMQAFPGIEKPWWYETPEERQLAEAEAEAKRIAAAPYKDAPRTLSDYGLGNSGRQALDDEFKRLTVALRGGACVKVQGSHLVKVEWPEWVYHCEDGAVVPGCNDDTWVDVLRQAEVARHPWFA